MSNTTVFRMTKIQSLQELNNKGKHCYDYSHKEIINFNKKGKYEKPFYTLVGKNGNVYRDVKNLKAKNEVVERKNSCKAIEMIFSLSPEFFKGKEEKQNIKTFTNRTMKFLNENFEGQIAHAVLHLHEETPHIHVFTVPFEVTTKKGRYDCEPYNLLKTKKYTPQFLSKLQNEYNKVFEDLGFKKIQQKQTKGIDRKELKDFYLEQAEENNENKKIITSLEVENELLKKDIELTKKDLKNTKQELSKLKEVVNLVMEFFKVDKLKELISKVKTQPIKEVYTEDFEEPEFIKKTEESEDDYVNNFYETQKQKLVPTKSKKKGIKRR